MDLLFKRSRKAGGRVAFNLWAKVDVTSEEDKPINKYKMNGAILADVFEPGLVRASLYFGIFAFLVIYLIVMF